MAKKICERPGCNNPIKTGKRFCSPKCSANRNIPIERPITYKNKIPKEVADMVTSAAGDAAPEILQLMDASVAPTSSSTRTKGDWVLTMDGKNELRPYSAISWDIIDQMKETGVIKFATHVKMAGVLVPFSSSRTWDITSNDKKLAKVVKAAMDDYMFQMVSDIVYSSIVYGVSVQELTFALRTPRGVGLTGHKLYTLPNMPDPVHPQTVTLHRNNGRFDGFTQTINGKNIRIQPENSLVIANERRFRRNWGVSSFKAAYPLWFWYEVVLRSMVRYMERMGTPVTVVSAPSKKKVRKPGTTDLVDAMTWGLKLAADAGMSSALSIPSEVDPETKSPYWDIKYLTSQERSQPFISVLEQLTQMILRSMVIADRAVSKDSGTTGSYAMAEVHAKAQRVQNQMTVAGILTAINRYLMPRIAFYNSTKATTLKMTTTTLDADAAEMIMKLFGMAGNSPATQDALGQIDFRAMGQDAGIPFISEEEARKMREKLKPQQPPPQNQDTPQDNLKQSYDDALGLIASGSAPILVTEEEVS